MVRLSPRPGRRTVATRVLLSYALVTFAFALSAGWGVFAQRSAATEADLMRRGYLPLSLALRDLVANQDTWNTQLNHITTARNPTDKRVWFETSLRIGRPKTFGEVRASISRAFASSGDESVRAVGVDLSREASAIEDFLAQDRELLGRLFDALDRGDAKRADNLRDELVTRGAQGKKRMSQLEQRVAQNVDSLLDAARTRERLAIRLLLALSGFTLLVGVLMAFYARRVLKPLAAVTDRAKSVARGDLRPHPVVPSKDEIGELATTFEGMVAAIARANEQLLSSERLATIGKMAAHVTHEVRNPLSSIALNVELLEEDLGEREDTKEAVTLLRAIKNEVERLTQLTEQYLSVARRQPLRLEEEQIDELVNEACVFMSGDLRRHGVELNIDIEEALPAVRVDEAQIKQALFNLLRNAREAMPNGGEVTLRVRRASGGGLDVTVDDEGSGMDEATRTHLFEPFFTTKGHGTGLGLAITRQIIEAHGGSIACEARREGGTRFWLHLPPRDEASPPPPASEA
ncbi:MAG: HAMP domain-containing protein [Myxococcales bacterium]|nr:HAMP domain-containing protein [Myxococcales bacterium]